MQYFTVSHLVWMECLESWQITSSYVYIRLILVPTLVGKIQRVFFPLLFYPWLHLSSHSLHLLLVIGQTASYSLIYSV